MKPHTSRYTFVRFPDTSSAALGVCGGRVAKSRVNVDQQHRNGHDEHEHKDQAQVFRHLEVQEGAQTQLCKLIDFNAEGEKASWHFTNNSPASVRTRTRANIRARVPVPLCFAKPSG